MTISDKWPLGVKLLEEEVTRQSIDLNSENMLS